MTGAILLPRLDLPDLPGAACVGYPPEWWWPQNSTPTARRALAVCATCPIATRQACLAYAEAMGIRDGVWGGTNRARTDHGGDTKRCARCGQTKPRSEFNRRVRAADGLNHYCRACAARERQRPPGGRRTLPVTRPECGTEAGYQAHIEGREYACPDCGDAELERARRTS